jgi:hypothetical protein
LSTNHNGIVDNELISFRKSAESKTVNELDRDLAELKEEINFLEEQLRADSRSYSPIKLKSAVEKISHFKKRAEILEDEMTRRTKGHKLSSNQQKLLRSIDKALESFGEAMIVIVYSELLQKKRLKRDEIVFHPEEFVDLLRSKFGEGYPTIEKRILDHIKNTFPGYDGFDESDSLLSTIKKTRRLGDE